MVPECIRSGNLFLWGTVICSLLDLDVGRSGAAFPDIEALASGGRFDDVVDNHPQDPPPVQLNGTLGQSISMVLKVPPGKNISKIKWEYESRGRKSRIATVANGEANLTDPSNGFGQRLEIVNQTTLRIVDLRAEDSGIYTAEVQFDTAETQTQKFALNVSGIANLPVEIRHVNATLGGSVLFPVAISPTKTVAEIEWKFQAPRGLALLVAEYSDGKLVRPNPKDRFGQRLEMADETTLKIDNLAREDSGVYTARVMFTTFAVLESLFSLTVYGAVNDPVQAPLHQVNGVLRRSVSLSVDDISPLEKVTRVEWDFQPQTGKGLFIAEIRDGKLERLDPKDRFGPRLELVNETTLRIRNLEKEDSGVYRALVRLHPAKAEVRIFRLTIYNPVPEPQILLLQETSDSSAECNVALQCSVSEKTGLNVSWRFGDALDPLNGGLDWYRFSSDGWLLHLSNLSNPTDSNVTCLVSNPADRKSASVNLTDTCSQPGSQNCFSWVRIAFALGLVIEISIVAILNLLERKDWVQN